jgi:uncharacterized membrane protein YhaH (DUF805 family)
MNTLSRAFSFDGRIGIGEYWVSLLISMALRIANPYLHVVIQLPLMIALIWFLLASGTKRCHDRGNPGIYMLIPFYVLVMAFGGSDPGSNGYGLKPNVVSQKKA